MQPHCCIGGPSIDKAAARCVLRLKRKLPIPLNAAEFYTGGFSDVTPGREAKGIEKDHWHFHSHLHCNESRFSARSGRVHANIFTLSLSVWMVL